jgi:hypothetical protein
VIAASKSVASGVASKPSWFFSATRMSLLASAAVSATKFASDVNILGSCAMSYEVPL